MGTWSAKSRLLATRSLKSSGWPRRSTGIPAMVMSTRAGSKGTPARPAAAKTRPQLGSAPANAVFTSGEVATVSAMRRAAASLCAPRTSISITRCAPSPSATICSASEWHTSSSAAVKSRCAFVPLLIGGAPASPLARTSSASFVEVSPSILMELKVRAVTSFSVFCSSDGAHRGRVPRGAGSAIGVARVYHHRAHAAFRRAQVRFGNQHRSGDYQVLREHSGGGSGYIARKNRKIERAGFFQAAGSRGEAEAAGKRGFGESVLHSRRGHGVGAMLTEGTSGPPRKGRRAKGGVFLRGFAEGERLVCSWVGSLCGL